jgi:hypothetical protein
MSNGFLGMDLRRRFFYDGDFGVRFFGLTAMRQLAIKHT